MRTECDIGSFGGQFRQFKRRHQNDVILFLRGGRELCLSKKKEAAMRERFEKVVGTKGDAFGHIEIDIVERRAAAKKEVGGSPETATNLNH